MAERDRHAHGTVSWTDFSTPVADAARDGLRWLATLDDPQYRAALLGGLEQRLAGPPASCRSATTRGAPLAVATAASWSCPGNPNRRVRWWNAIEEPPWRRASTRRRSLWRPCRTPGASGDPADSARILEEDFKTVPGHRRLKFLRARLGLGRSSNGPTSWDGSAGPTSFFIAAGTAMRFWPRGRHDASRSSEGSRRR